MKKKILYTIPNFDTAGSGKALLNLALRLDRDHFESHIACLHDRGDFFKVVKDSGIPVYVFDFISPARPFTTLFKSAWKVSRKLKDIKPHLIHSFHYGSEYTEPLAAKMAGIPWTFTKKSMSWGGSSAKAWKLRSALAKGIIIQNSDMIEQIYPNSSKTFWIPRGVDTTRFAPAQPDPAIRAEMKTGADKRILINVANLVPVKGIEVLIKAFEQIHEEFPDWVVWIVGDDQNEYGQNIKNLAHEIKLDHKIVFSGKKADIKPYLEHSEVFILPTKDEGRREGSPVALLEAMANGKIVVGSAVPGIKDQLKAYPEHLFKPGDFRHLAQLLRPLMKKTPHKNKTLGEHFRELVLKEFTIEQEVARHEDFYQKVLSSNDLNSGTGTFKTGTFKDE